MILPKTKISSQAARKILKTLLDSLNDEVPDSYPAHQTCYAVDNSNPENEMILQEAPVAVSYNTDEEVLIIDEIPGEVIYLHSTSE